jgi:L,D-transpeptidase YcbB
MINEGIMMFTKFKNLSAVCGLFFLSAVNAEAGIWMNGGGLTACGQKAYELLSNAGDDGLSPADFQFAVQAVERAKRGQGSFSAAEGAFNDAVARYIEQIRNGRFDPRSADHRIVMRPDRVNGHSVISQNGSSNSCEWLSQQEPPYQGYKQLKPVLKKYRQIAAATPNWPRLPAEGLNCPPGDYNDNIPGVRQVLAAYGLLSSGDGGSYYDDDVLEAVKAFQASHGLLVDGRLGAQTVKELNKSPQDRVRQLIINMERWRWMPRNPGQRYIRVNIAGFELEAVENGQIVLRSPIIVGTDYRETPVFSATMTEVKFNPSWHVPQSLAIKDKLPKIKEDPSWLTNNHFVLTTNVNGREVEISPHSVNWKNVHAGNFNYQLRQTPGSYNALGKIRFTIISPFGVYLHSTPDQYLFDFPIRTFSSGCIRVKKVAELGEFVLNNPGVWSVSRIEQEMQGSQTKAVPLSRNIPVHVTYFSVFTDENGAVHFNPDVYGQDAHVAAAMRRWL